MATNNSWNNQVAAAKTAITLNSGTNTVNISTDAAATTVNVATGGGVKASTFGSTNSTSATTVQSGSGALNVTATGGAMTLNSGAGALSISSDASATTVNVGTGSAAKTVALGSSNTTSALTLNSGSGGITTTGVYGVVPSGISIQPVVMDSSGQLGTGVPPAVAFSAYRSSDVSNVTGDGTLYTASYDVAVVNISSSYDDSTFTFTAPSTGLYQFNMTIASSNLTLAHSLGQIKLVTTGRTYFNSYTNWGISAASDTMFISSFSQLAPMNSGDTAFVQFGVFSSTKTITFVGGDTFSAFSGYSLPPSSPASIAFMAYISSGTIPNITGDGSQYQMQYNSIVVNLGSGFDSTGTFTAPVAGLYQMNATVGVVALNALNTTGYIELITSQRTYTSVYGNWGGDRASNDIFMQSFSQLVPMDQFDQAYVQVTVSGNPTSNVGAYGDNVNSAFSGYLIG